ncbi:hypothetical protein, partial [Luteibacter sp.]|uniref:hypothetical protein n=1 Tax=Luteibacter sp. TaxID=1886636 RepID=UPI003F7E8F13
GQVNVIGRPRGAAACRQALVDGVLLAVDGQWKSMAGVRHLGAHRLLDFSDLLPAFGSVSRDFQ